jgi:2-polyprenyl-3-methyl-5-hydroxy-6-metoxy-1,4-benzoquinol methylase
MSAYKDYGYDNNLRPIHFNYVEPAIMNWLDKNRNQTILDIGCGNGYLINDLIAKGYNAYGTDASVKGIEQARKTNPGHFFVQDVSSGQLPAELRQLKFDTIICTEVIEHLYDPADFIAFCRSILVPGGEIIISTPYHGYLKNLFLSVFNKWDTHISPLWLGGHIKFWSRDTLTKLLTEGGFDPQDFKGCGRLPYLWMSMLVKAQVR